MDAQIAYPTNAATKFKRRILSSSPNCTKIRVLLNEDRSCKNARTFRWDRLPILAWQTIKRKGKKEEEEGKTRNGKKATGRRRRRRWSAAIMETRPLFGRFGTRGGPSKRKCRTIFTELRAERANSRSDVDTYVRFRPETSSSWSAMSSSSSSLIVCFLLLHLERAGYKSEKTRARVCSHCNRSCDRFERRVYIYKRRKERKGSTL